MSWTVACFCGTVFESPADRCPTCHTPVPEVTRAADAADSEPPDRLLADAEEGLEVASLGVVSPE
jgi:hypothetical protein